MNLSLIDLQIGYKKKLLKNPINIQAENGQLIALVGKNGIGKSTLLKTIAGIISPINGKIFFDNTHITSKKQIAENISIVLNERPLETLNVYEVLQLGRLPYLNFFQKLKKNDKQIIEKIVQQLNLQKILNKNIGQISDGERQLVMIARTLIQETPIILLDEPTTHLDIQNKAEIIKILKQLTLKGKTVIFSTHDINLSLSSVDIIWLMNNASCISLKTDSFSKDLKDEFITENLLFDEANKIFRINP